jgi:hypothetical protein
VRPPRWSLPASRQTRDQQGALADGLLAGLDRGDRRVGEEGGQLADGAFAAGQQVGGHLGGGDVRGAAQRQRRGEAGQQGAGFGTRLPPGQGEGGEPVLELGVGADREVGLAGADADQRYAQLIAQEPDQVQELPPLVAAAAEDVVQFVDDQDPDGGRPQDPERDLLKVGEPGLPAGNRGACCGQQRGVEPAHRGVGGHLDRQHGDFLPVRVGDGRM